MAFAYRDASGSFASFEVSGDRVEINAASRLKDVATNAAY